MNSRSKWTLLQLKRAVKSSNSIREVIKKLGLIPAGGNYTQINTAIAKHHIETYHFTGKGWRKNKKFEFTPRKSLDDILKNTSSFQSFKLKRRLIAAGLKEAKCELCGWADRSPDGRIPVELDHINGDRLDNRLENLRVLCPNCHSLQPTHRGMNQKRRGGGMVDARHLKCRE